MAADRGGYRDAYLLGVAIIGQPEESAWGGVADDGQRRRLLVASGSAVQVAMPAFRDKAGDDRELAIAALRRSLAERAIVELQDAVREGGDPEQPGAELILLAEDVRGVLAESSKDCRFKRRDDRGLWCTVDAGGVDAPTTGPLCRSCSLPADNLRCSALTHPRVTTDGTRRTPVGALCDAGFDSLLGDLSACQPGGNTCWRRDLTVEIQQRHKPDTATQAASRTGSAAPRCFISYAHEDKPLARAIAEGLKRAGYRVWIDEGELVIGDSLVRKIAEAVAETDYLVALVSASSEGSGWCQKELAIAVTTGLNQVRELVLPVRVGEATMPPVLGDILYGVINPAEPGALVAQLCTAIQVHEVRRNSGEAEADHGVLDPLGPGA